MKEEINAGLFNDAQCNEIQELMDKGVFDIVPDKDILRGIRIFKSHMVNEWKAWGTENAYAKSR